MSVRVGLYIALILLVLLAVAVIVVAALVRRPRREWEEAVLGQTREVKGQSWSSLRMNAVRPRRVSLEEMWATNSVPYSAYVAAPKIPDRQAVAAALAPAPEGHAAWRELQLMIPKSAAGEEVLEASAQGRYTDARPPQAAPPPPPPPSPDPVPSDAVAASPAPVDYLARDPFYSAEVRDGAIAISNAALQNPNFDDEAWVGYQQEASDGVQSRSPREVVTSALESLSGVWAGAKRKLDDARSRNHGKPHEAPAPTLEDPLPDTQGPAPAPPDGNSVVAETTAEFDAPAEPREDWRVFPTNDILGVDVEDVASTKPAPQLPKRIPRWTSVKPTDEPKGN